MKHSPLKAPGVVKAGASKNRMSIKPIGTTIKPKELASARKSSGTCTDQLAPSQITAKYYAADEEAIPILNRLDLQTITDYITGMSTSRRLPTSRLAGSSLSQFMPQPVSHDGRTARMNLIKDRRDSFDTDQNLVFYEARATRVNALRYLQDPREMVDAKLDQYAK